MQWWFVFLLLFFLALWLESLALSRTSKKKWHGHAFSFTYILHFIDYFLDETKKNTIFVSQLCKIYEIYVFLQFCYQSISWCLFSTTGFERQTAFVLFSSTQVDAIVCFVYVFLSQKKSNRLPCNERPTHVAGFVGFVYIFINIKRDDSSSNDMTNNVCCFVHAYAYIHHT